MAHLPASVVLSPSYADVAPWKTAFLAELRTSGYASLACRTVGIGIARAYHERERDPAFAQAWEEARTACLG